MNETERGSDAAVLAVLGQRLARHRLRQNLTQAELAREAGVSTRTISRLEAGESTQLTNLVRVLRALGLLAGLGELVPEPPESPLEQLRRQGRPRQRASSRRDETEAEPWRWGEDDPGGEA